jgi:hypothetical protein
MRKRLVALAIAFVSAAAPVSGLAGPLPPDTTIYIGVGVRDTGGMFSNSGTSTTIICSNGSGVEVNIRFAVFHTTGPLAGQHSIAVSHGRTVTVATRATAAFFDFASITPNTVLDQGTLIIEATTPACSAAAISPTAPLRRPSVCRSGSCA